MATRRFISNKGDIKLIADLDANSNKIINLATPTAAGNATSKSYVDGLKGQLATSTAAPEGTVGLMYFNTGDSKLYCYNGTTWKEVTFAS